jgi:hypothetical protein
MRILGCDSGAGDVRPPEDSPVAAEVVMVAVVVAMVGALLLRAWSRTWRPIIGPPSCPAQSPQV